MTAVAEFPSNCSTNTIVLQDFGEVAYIVCTVSIPPQNHNAPPDPSPESNLARLKHTEKQFHQASILASIDNDALQLFTFYKKIDVLKDQRTILTKFGQILRSNSCTISYKAAARAPDLLKPENGRLYRLFITAVLANIEITVTDGRRLTPLGQRYHAVEVLNAPRSLIENDLEEWALMRTDLQMVHTGQIILTVSEQRHLTPLTVSARGLQQPIDYGKPWRAMPVVLAPTGQLAVYRNGWIGRAEDGHGHPKALSKHLLASLHIWQGLFEKWSKLEPYVDTQIDDLWAELSIPVQEQPVTEPPTSPNAKKHEIKSSMSFKTLFWPAKWCFAFDLSRGFSDDGSGTEAEYDPVQFILEWFETLGNGDYGLSHSTNRTASADNDDASIFPEDTAFENAETFQPFGPPVFPASQTVYPTPPDVVMTHATPAMSSVDGMAATPATLSRIAAEASTLRQDQAMEVDSGIAVGVGSGLYDEDLFEDMPDEAFGQNAAGDEPNWDFFDKPTLEAEAADIELADAMDVDPLTQPSDGAGDEEQNNAAGNVSAPQVSKAETLASQQHEEMAEQVPSSVSPSEDAPKMGRASADPLITEEFPAPESGDTRPRRPSVFDGVHRRTTSPQRDQRYTATGSFHFNARAAPTKMAASPPSLDQWIKRSPSPSVSSDSDLSGYETPIYADSPLEYRIPTPGQLPDESTSMAAEGQNLKIDTEALEQEAHLVFELVSVQHTRSTLDDAVVFAKPAGLGSQFDKPNVRNGFAHEVVHQITQTCLLHDVYGVSSLTVDGASRHDVSLTMGNLADGTGFSNVAHLCGIVPPTSGKKPIGRTTRLPEPEVTMKRLDKQITARPSILPFWDTLGLQPAPKSKDVTAFCLHPHGSGMADSCLDFLDRISDAYVSCNLGQHQAGSIAGVSSDGLLEADPNDQGMFLGPVRRLGEALAKPTQKGGTLVIYLIANSRHDMAYVYCSVAAYAIRRHVEQGWAKRSEQLNLVFQVVPPDFVASSQEVVVPAQSAYNSVALGVYSRIPPFDIETSLGICEYPLVLPEGRDGVNFGLEAGVISPLSKDGACLHVGYSWSDDRRWLVAAWTDARGFLSFVMPYQIKSHILGPARSIDEVVKDMWAISHELMARQRNRWKLVVSRAGTFEAPEINAWMSVANSRAESAKSKCSLSLLTVELNPTLRIFPQAEHGKSAQNAYGTPASTPQGGVTSPEQVVAATPTPGGTSTLNAPTPPEQGFDPNADNDLSIVDPGEESWAVILPYGVNQSKDILEIRPAVASGYLVKRNGIREEDGLTMLGVHMIWPTPNPSTTPPGQREDELEDLVNDFRGLVTLAAARGCIDKATSCVPWHIHTSVTGATTLGKLI
ncbi:uncharacterized protein HMPREF1541_05843 [Cyphellophora europaea CBS 101466]|uniref:Mediator of RNA polymerase II transcription subunit 13 n=1 Tax=Cyphellophora europaea (strain CBS 101466) TaxID=1220924 RepID=W2RT27_CYPE1|nr:uncharacterized protein HMPREF1541_05843 [Cyphellophora europaea CBS 101466]ETN39617.1 hypothetical protein HMPREF1541_05843 [Cyphellophora europaea CBS 101466]